MTINSIDSKFEQLDHLIGRTPLAEISLKYKGNDVRVYVKLEHYNYTGSIKDRIALHMIRKAYARKTLKEGDVIVEGTSGNTGISLAAAGAFLGHKVVIYMPDWMTEERKRLMRSFGAEVRLVSKEQGGFLALENMISAYVKTPGVFSTRQFSNGDNSEAHELTTGKEIISQMKRLDAAADAIVAGVGTGGTVMGISKALQTVNPHIMVFPLEPDNSLIMSGGNRNERHFIHGIGDGFIPDIIKGGRFEGIITANQVDSVIMAQMLAKTFGLGVGISSGANLLGAIKVLERIGFDRNVVTVFADDSKKYLSGEYSEVFPMKEEYLTKDVILQDMRIVR